LSLLQRSYRYNINIIRVFVKARKLMNKAEQKKNKKIKKPYMQLEIIQPYSEPNEKIHNQDNTGSENEDTGFEKDAVPKDDIPESNTIRDNFIEETKQAIRELIRLNEDSYIHGSIERSFRETGKTSHHHHEKTDQNSLNKTPESSSRKETTTPRRTKVKKKTPTEQLEQEDSGQTLKDVIQRSLKNPNFYSPAYQRSNKPNE